MTLRENISWTWRLSRGYRLPLLLNAMLGSAVVGLSLLFIWLSKSLVDRAVSGELESMMVPALQIIGVIVVRQLCSILRIRIDNISSTKMINALRERLFYRVMMSRWSGREQFHTGDVTTRLDGDVRKICETICTKMPMLFIIGIEFVSAFVFLMALDRRLAWVLIVIMPVSLLLSKRYMNRMRSLTHSIREIDSNVQAHIQEQVLHRNVVSSMGNTSGSISSLNNLSTMLFERSMQRTNYTLFSRAVVQFGFSMGYITAFLWGVEGLSSGTVSFGMMTAFLQLVARVQSPIVEISTHISSIAQTTSSIDRVVEIEEMEMEMEGDDEVLAGAVGVRIEGVNFRYDAEDILHNFSYDFRPNELHVIVGETGCGKSTLLRLMLGFLSPTQGRVEIYNRDEALTVSSLTRSNFVYVPQGNTLISGTIRDNILLGDPTASDEQIEAALHTAVAGFVYDLPDGLDTICGERGSGLSEGEAQRVAIARGLLRNGGVLLFDEPTSALDSETEKLLMERLKTYAKSRTLIMVTHRKTTDDICSSTIKLNRRRR